MPLSQSIHALPSDVIAKIKSSTSIVHLTGVILELVKNALDANAHIIFITVDFKRGGCIVEDDGDGIPPIEFESTGGLGKPHHTSKFEQNDLYGHYGLFLASLASLSLLTLSSHCVGHECTNTIIFHHSKPVARLIPAPQHEILRSANHGTSVTVNDLFGNMPVRVKSRALGFQRAGELDREWENLKTALVSLLLANPRISKLVLSDAEKSRVISLRPSGSSTSTDHSGDYPFDFRRIGSILTQSGLISSRSWDYWHELSASIPDLSIRAAISLQPSPTRRTQFISLGNEPIFPRNSSNILYSEINRLFSLSDFDNAGVRPDQASSRGPASLVDGNDAQSNTSIKSWTRPINKWPMFYIRIDTRAVLRLGDDNQEFPESDNSIQRIVEVLGAMVGEFLKQHNMRPRVKRQSLPSDRTQSMRSKSSITTRGSAQGLPRGRLVSSTDEAFSGHLKLPSFSRSQAGSYGQDFTSWSRVKAAKVPQAPSRNEQPRPSGSGSYAMQEDRELPTRTEPRLGGSSNGQETPILPKSSDLIVPGNDKSTTETQPGEVSPDQMITWIDPHTKLAYLINPRTGQTLNSRKSLATKTARLANPEIPRDPANGLWIESLLETWDNPAFSRAEAPISNLGTDALAQHASNTSHDCFKGIGSLSTAHVAKYRGKLRRRGLELAQVIAQVDKKFILAKVPTTALKVCENGTSSDVLLLIDQHAADERCRIEQLYQELFLGSDRAFAPDSGVQTVQVLIHFEVSETEGCLFNKYTAFLAAWGIHYDTEAKSKSSTLITVRTLPALIAERCRAESHVLIDLMKREIWSREESGRTPFQPKQNLESEYEDQVLGPLDDEDLTDEQPTIPPVSHFWVQKMNGCPQGILDLLNSRACRTAIMFNDSLNIEECQALVYRLARCAFPFQCAHGRPSIVPILDLRSLPGASVTLPLDLDTSTPSDDHPDLHYMEAFRARYIT